MNFIRFNNLKGFLWTYKVIVGGGGGYLPNLLKWRKTHQGWLR